MTFENIPPSAIVDIDVYEDEQQFKIEESTTYDYTNIFDMVNLFIKSKNRNQWLDDGVIKLYIRKSKRFINGEFIDFIDIANISVDENHQNVGIFREFMSLLISKYPHVNIYVESILNSYVTKVLTKLDFIKLGNDEYDVNMYRLKKPL